jgi:hypothetical protein
LPAQPSALQVEVAQASTKFAEYTPSKRDMDRTPVRRAMKSGRRKTFCASPPGRGRLGSSLISSSVLHYRTRWPTLLLASSYCRSAVS